MFKIKFHSPLQGFWPAFWAIGFISVIYILAAITLLRSYSANIKFTEKELQGLQQFTSAADLYLDLHKTHNIEDIRQKIMALPHESTNNLWWPIQEKLQQQPLEFSAFTALLRQLIRDIGDQSNLILDPEIPSYYATTTLLNHVPLLVEHIAIYRQPPSHHLPDIPFHLENLTHAQKKISAYRPEYANQIAAATAHIKNILLQSTTLPHPVETFDKLINDIETITAATTTLLQGFLQERLVKQIQHYRTMVTIIMALYVMLVASIMLAFLNHVSKKEKGLAHERKKLITQLAEKNDDLEKFAHAAAHDLKEPVRTMRCFATLLKNEMAPALTDSTHEYIEIIENTAKRAEEMINDLLGYTRVSEEALAIESCDCATEFLAVLEDLKPLIDELNPTIHAALLPTIHTVPSMFRRVMLNLLDNAIKYRQLDRPLIIEINAALQAENWLFTVADNGIGIANEYKDSVFEPFRRLEPSLYQAGNGIGLTSCKKIIERLGGKIWLESNLNQGTTIYFLLPR
ncbi:MAG: sensor histidine kinase [Alphaproteobacteria bacterium]